MNKGLSLPDIGRSFLRILLGNSLAQLLVGTLGVYLVAYLPVEAYAEVALYQSSMMMLVGVVAIPFGRAYLVSNGLDLSYVYIFQGALYLFFMLFLYVYIDDVYVFSMFFIFGFMVLLFEYLKSHYQKNLRFSVCSLLVSTRSAVYVVLVFITFNYLGEVNDYSHVLAMSAFVSFSLVGVLFYVIYGGVPLLQFSDDKKAVDVLKEYGWLIFYLIFSSIFSQMDFIFLRFYSDVNEVANYGVSFQYYLILIIFMQSFKQVLLPMIKNNEYATFAGASMTLIPVYLIYIATLSLILIAFPYWSSYVEAGKYDTTYVVFSILCVSSVFSLVFGGASEFLQARGFFRIMFVYLSISILVNITLNYLLVFNYGAKGVAFSTMVSALLLNLLFSHFCWKKNV